MSRPSSGGSKLSSRPSSRPSSFHSSSRSSSFHSSSGGRPTMGSSSRPKSNSSSFGLGGSSVDDEMARLKAELGI